MPAFGRASQGLPWSRGVMPLANERHRLAIRRVPDAGSYVRQSPRQQALSVQRRRLKLRLVRAAVRWQALEIRRHYAWTCGLWDVFFQEALVRAEGCSCYFDNSYKVTYQLIRPSAHSTSPGNLRLFCREAESRSVSRRQVRSSTA